jgi:hypothetical protein
MESPSSFKKKATGLTRGLPIFERCPRAAHSVCPGLHFRSSHTLTEEGRLIDKAKKAKMKETNLLSSSDHGSPYHLFFEKSQ